MKQLLAICFLAVSLTAFADDKTVSVDSVIIENAVANDTAGTVETTCGEVAIVCPWGDNALQDMQKAPTYSSKGERLFQNRWVQSTYIGVPLVVGGLIEKAHNKHFRTLRNGFLPKFHNEVDNYLQYSPALAMYLMKIAGVESRSSWGKMLTADALSISIMTMLVNGTKYTAKVERPDGSARNSFPSGHTATAFMLATMLHKEYSHLSPWVSVAGYTAATSTGVMRMMNNRHWMSDILAGAGIGIVSTEFGYWLADIMFPSHAKSYDPATTRIDDEGRNPSFISTYAGFYVPLNHHNIHQEVLRRSTNGGSVGVEGAWFWSKNFGFGGQASVSDVNYIIDGGERVEDSSHFYSLKAGVYFNQTVYERLFFGAHALAGVTTYPDTENNLVEANGRAGLSTLAGVNIGLRARQHLDFKVGCDFEMLHSPAKDVKYVKALLLTGGVAYHF